MRWAILLGLAVASPADARPRPPPRHVAPEPDNFWREIVEPHAEEVRGLLERARAATHNADAALAQNDTEWDVEQRRAFYADAYELLRRARALSPAHPQVLALLGKVADELGKTREAIGAYQACIDVLGPERAGSEVTGSLGAIYLRMGQRDAAIRWLRQAQGSITTSAPALVHLANALAARGDLRGAIDTLANALPPTFGYGYSSGDIALVAFALAVIYDRDEQRAAAFEILDRMQSSLQQQFTTLVQAELIKFRYAPAEDRHYFQALLYEALGYDVEARAEWALYAASGASPWRARALAHIAELDRIHREAAAGRPGARRPGRPVEHPAVPNPGATP